MWTWQWKKSQSISDQEYRLYSQHNYLWWQDMAGMVICHGFCFNHGGLKLILFGIRKDALTVERVYYCTFL